MDKQLCSVRGNGVIADADIREGRNVGIPFVFKQIDDAETLIIVHGDEAVSEHAARAELAGDFLHKPGHFLRVRVRVRMPAEEPVLAGNHYGFPVHVFRKPGGIADKRNADLFDNLAGFRVDEPDGVAGIGRYHHAASVRLPAGGCQILVRIQRPQDIAGHRIAAVDLIAAGTAEDFAAVRREVLHCKEDIGGDVKGGGSGFRPEGKIPVAAKLFQFGLDILRPVPVERFG